VGQQCLQHSATDQPRYRLMDQSIGARFWEKVNCGAPCKPHMATNCWEWQGATNKDGYGRFRTLNGKLERAHGLTLSWVLGYRPAYVMHLCDNPACVRASHLKESTHSLNMRDAYAKGRRPKCIPEGTNSKLSRFTMDQILDIRRRCSNGETQSSIAKSYATSQSHISQIIRRRSYQNVA
jgi:hypothetical protein